MDRRISLWLIVVGTLCTALPAGAQTYSGTVLYPLTGPSGYTNVTPNSSSTSIPPATYGGATVGAGTNGGSQHALFWNSGSTVIDLNPTALGITSSEAVGTNGNQQVGSSGSGHALLWNGTAASAIDLGLGQAIGVSPNGAQQVGVLVTGARLWNSTAASAIDINPTALLGAGTTSRAYATDGVNQVGQASAGGVGFVTAMLWSGTAASAVNLGAGSFRSSANGVFGTQEVGFNQALSSGSGDAALWSGTAASLVDLAPTVLSGFFDSDVFGTNGTEQVGNGSGSITGRSSNYHALLWYGTADSAVDLHVLLPSSDTWKSSQAFSIDSSGNVFGIATDTSGNTFAVEWTPVPEPEPASVAMLGMIGVGMMMRRRRYARK